MEGRQASLKQCYPRIILPPLIAGAGKKYLFFKLHLIGVLMGGGIKIHMNIFRKEYRVLEPTEIQQMNEIKDKAQELYDLIESVSDSREKSLSKTALEESVMWIVKKITG